MQTKNVEDSLLLVFFNENIRYKKNIGFVMVVSDFFNATSKNELGAVDLFLDFLGDCRVLEEKTIQHNGAEVHKFLIQHKELPPTEDLENPPYYNVHFEPDGSYWFRESLNTTKTT